MILKFKSRLALPALLVTASLISCSSAPTRFFTLYAVAPTAPRADYTGPPVRVDAVHLPPALDRVEVVSDIGPGEVKVNEFDHWSAPLGQSARQALSEDLLARLPQGSVIFPHLNKPDGALGIAVDVLDFQSDTAGARLEASWSVTSGTDKKTSSAVLLHTDVTGTGADSVVRSMSTLLGELADRIAAGL